METEIDNDINFSFIEDLELEYSNTKDLESQNYPNSPIAMYIIPEETLNIIPKKRTINSEMDNSDTEGKEFEDDDYRWRKNGRKLKKIDKKQSCIRQHYCCSFQNITNCTAKMYKDDIPNSKPFVKGTHNHNPPITPRTSPDTIQYVKGRLANRDKAATIHRDLVNHTNGPIDPKNCPSKIQMNSWKSHMFHRYLPSHNALENIITMFGGRFLHKISLYPKTQIVLASETQLVLLQQYGKTIYIDGTFGICKEKLALTTIFVRMNESVGLPVAWLFLIVRIMQLIRNFSSVFKKRLILDGNLKLD